MSVDALKRGVDIARCFFSIPVLRSESGSGSDDKQCRTIRLLGCGKGQVSRSSENSGQVWELDVGEGRVLIIERLPSTKLVRE